MDIRDAKSALHRADKIETRLVRDHEGVTGIELLFHGHPMTHVMGVTVAGARVLRERLNRAIDMLQDERSQPDREIDTAVEEAKREILEDIGTATNSKGDVMPETISTFSELHDYVDANTYAGLCEARREHWTLGDVIEFQNRVDAWLRAGRPE